MTVVVELKLKLRFIRLGACEKSILHHFPQMGSGFRSLAQLSCLHRGLEHTNCLTRAWGDSYPTVFLGLKEAPEGKQCSLGIGFTLQDCTESLLQAGYMSQVGKLRLQLSTLQLGTFSKFPTVSVLNTFWI